MSGTYSRLYYKFSREFPAVYADDAALAGWVRLLLVADSSWPLCPPLPRSVPPRVVKRLTEAGLLILDGDNYTLRGLEAERTRRRDTASNAAAMRWQSERNASAMPSKAEQSIDRAERETPPPPAERGRRVDGTNPRSLGTAPRDTGDNLRATGGSIRQARHNLKHGETALPGVLRAVASAGFHPVPKPGKKP